MKLFDWVLVYGIVVIASTLFIFSFMDFSKVDEQKPIDASMYVEGLQPIEKVPIYYNLSNPEQAYLKDGDAFIPVGVIDG